MLFQVTQAGWQERQYCDTRAVQWRWGNGTPHKKKLWRAGICLEHFRLLPQKRDYIFRLLSHSLTRPACVLLRVYVGNVSDNMPYMQLCWHGQDMCHKVVRSREWTIMGCGRPFDGFLHRLEYGAHILYAKPVKPRQLHREQDCMFWMQNFLRALLCRISEHPCPGL